MCTVSWSVEQKHLSLCFNRDERKSRGEASGPKVLDLGGVQTIAAIDADAGGTWLAVNEFGLCVFLLNNYGAEALRRKRLPAPRSRGELPIRFTSSQARCEVLSSLKSDQFDEYNPFILGVADVEGVSLFAWDGEGLKSVQSEGGFVTTSSFNTHEVESYRKSSYEAALKAKGEFTADDRRLYHVSTPHEDAAFNPMMLRNDSRTRSVSTIDVCPARVAYRYEAVREDTRQLADAEIEAFQRVVAWGKRV